ncbi:MAG: hypothetical protein ABSF32_07460 [Ignavibacteria bacterium]|jgi:hypothetical protein
MIILLNPRSATYAFRVPNTILTLGAFLEGKYDYFLLDENSVEMLKQVFQRSPLDSMTVSE